MADRFNLPHFDVSNLASSAAYKSHSTGGGSRGQPRDRAHHAQHLRDRLRRAIDGATVDQPADEPLPGANGRYLEVQLTANGLPEEVERKRDGVRTGAVVEHQSSNTKTVALLLSEESENKLNAVLKAYASGPLSERTGNPPHRTFAEAIEDFNPPSLETLWSDDMSALPSEADPEMWWEAWCIPERVDDLLKACEAIQAQVANQEYYLFFPEATVIPVLSDRIKIEKLTSRNFGIFELRRAEASPSYFLDADKDEQYDWATEMAERTIWPGSDAPAVCLLDTGVNRGHVLIEPALSQDDMGSINPNWVTTDTGEGHGTGMAGLALHGDLTTRLQETTGWVLEHRLESVRIMPPTGFPSNDPRAFGAITSGAIALAESKNPKRARTICMAVTNEGVKASKATSWSAAVDQLASGALRLGEDEPKRLILISAGNAPSPSYTSDVIDPSLLPVEEPAQAWNALTVGGYTEKTNVVEEGFENWRPLAKAGDISPFTRTSVPWADEFNRTPFKPEIVMEAGNRATSPNGLEVTNLDSLLLLTTGTDAARSPLEPFNATSAATAQAARLAARLMAQFPNYWPETIRALIVHSAEWTRHMRSQIDAAGNKSDRQVVLRHFGYGVPSFERAAASARNHLALVAQNTIQPFGTEEGKKKFNECHYYKLPWPKNVLEELGNQNIELKITLSYFIEPNPGSVGSISPNRYQSHGLRFDLKRETESDSDFIGRTNKKISEQIGKPENTGGRPDRWTFGANSVSCGSLHCDIWSGPAIELANCDMVCIRPVGGWWRERAKRAVRERETRYSVILTIRTEDQTIDLHTSIKTIVEATTPVEIGIL